MLVHNRLTSLDAAPSSRRVDLLDTRVGGLEAVQALLEHGAEAVVGLHGIDEKGVTTGLGLFEDVQKRGARWLLLVRDVAMPGHRTQSSNARLLGGPFHRENLGEGWLTGWRRKG